MRWNSYLVRKEALAKIYTMHSFAPVSNLKFFVKICILFWKICQSFADFAGVPHPGCYFLEPIVHGRPQQICAPTSLNDDTQILIYCVNNQKTLSLRLTSCNQSGLVVTIYKHEGLRNRKAYFFPNSRFDLCSLRSYESLLIWATHKTALLATEMNLKCHTNFGFQIDSRTKFRRTEL